MRGMVKRVLKLVSAVAVVIIAVTFGLAYWFVTRTHPQSSGTLHVPELKSRVQVIRDPFGVPQIYADNTDDLFFGQGYVHAQDRLWQMELNRHIGLGQLSELFGDVVFGSSTTVEVDKFLRTIGLASAARADWTASDEGARHDLQQYADGVNAFLRTHQD